MKKGQTEMMGLLMIVVLILVIGVIFLKFSLGKQDLKPDLRTNVQTTNLLRAVMKASLNDGSVSDAIIDCSMDNTLCNQIRDKIREILGISIGAGKTYSFTANNDNGEILNIGTCQGTGIVASNQINEKGSFVEAKLKVCEE